MSSPTFAFLAAALLMASITHADMSTKPQSPIRNGAAARPTAHRVPVAARRSAKRFSGTFEGKFDNFGNKGTFTGGFKGDVRGRKVTVKLGARSWEHATCSEGATRLTSLASR